MCKYCGKYVHLYPLEYHSIGTRENWHNLLETSLVASPENPVRQGNPLPVPGTNTDRTTGIRWGFTVLTKKLNVVKRVEFGLGVPTKEGRVDRRHNHFIISKGYIIINNHVVRKIRDETFRPSFEMIYYTQSGEASIRNNEIRHVMGNFDLFSLKKHKFPEDSFKEGLFPIMGIETNHGFLNLIPSSKPASLENLCAKKIAEGAHSIQEINQLIIPKTCVSMIKMEWFRYHQLRVFGYKNKDHDEIIEGSIQWS